VKLASQIVKHVLDLQQVAQVAFMENQSFIIMNVIVHVLMEHINHLGILVQNVLLNVYHVKALQIAQLAHNLLLYFIIPNVIQPVLKEPNKHLLILVKNMMEILAVALAEHTYHLQILANFAHLIVIHAKEVHGTVQVAQVPNLSF